MFSLKRVEEHSLILELFNHKRIGADCEHPKDPNGSSIAGQI